MMLHEKRSTIVPSVLAVDDDCDNLLLISYVLESLNCKCYGVSDSRKVLDLAVDRIPALILLDIVMPYMSGFEVISQLKSNLFTKNIPVIAVTGLTSPHDQAKIRSAGFQDYICKPFMLEKLEDKLAKYFNSCLVQAAA
jgi:CheY-like chemotaxis protein